MPLELSDQIELSHSARIPVQVVYQNKKIYLNLTDTN